MQLSLFYIFKSGQRSKLLLDAQVIGKAADNV